MKISNATRLHDKIARDLLGQTTFEATGLFLTIFEPFEFSLIQEMDLQL